MDGNNGGAASAMTYGYTTGGGGAQEEVDGKITAVGRAPSGVGRCRYVHEGSRKVRCYVSMPTRKGVVPRARLTLRSSAPRSAASRP